MKVPEEAEMKREQARSLRERADQLEDEAYSIVRGRAQQVMRENQDRLLNRTQTLELLPIGTLESLKNWERKYRPLGYLEFQNNKILRSEVLRLLDDYQSGQLHKKLQAQL